MVIKKTNKEIPEKFRQFIFTTKCSLENNQTWSKSLFESRTTLEPTFHYVFNGFENSFTNDSAGTLFWILY